MKKDIPVLILMLIGGTTIAYLVKNGMDSLPALNVKDLIVSFIITIFVVSILYFLVFKRGRSTKH